MLIAILLLSIPAFAASIKVTGRVQDVNGEPLIGVSVKEKGTNNVTVTDVNGTYNITCTSDKPVLVAEYIGFEPEERKVTGTLIDFVLKDKVNKIWENFPITVKITLWYTAFIVILIVIMLTVSFTVADKMTGDLNQRELMESVVEMASEMVSNPDEFDDFDDGMYFVKYNNAGIEMAGMSPRGFDLTLNFAENTVRTYEKNGEKYYYFDKKIDNSEGEWVRGIVPVNQLSDEVSKLLIIILILSPLLLLIIVYGGYRIVKKALNPVAKISDTASEIQKNGDFSKRIKIDEGKDEIHRMADTFNQMLNSLENSYIREKQFSSDVSHELRTPVSVILTESQYSLEYADTMEEAKNSFSVIQRQAKRMSELINQIMELSKIEKQIIIPTKKIKKFNIFNLSLLCLSQTKENASPTKQNATVIGIPLLRLQLNVLSP